MDTTAEDPALHRPDDPARSARDLPIIERIASWCEEFLSRPHPELGRGGSVCPFVPARHGHEKDQFRGRAHPEPLDGRRRSGDRQVPGRLPAHGTAVRAGGHGQGDPGDPARCERGGRARRGGRNAPQAEGAVRRIRSHDRQVSSAERPGWAAQPRFPAAAQPDSAARHPAHGRLRPAFLEPRRRSRTRSHQVPRGVRAAFRRRRGVPMVRARPGRAQ
jgi:hypothetical protein